MSIVTENQGQPCPNCGDTMSDTASNLLPTWSDDHDNVVCWWCATHASK